MKKDDRLKRIFRWEPQMWMLAFFSLGVFVLLLIPLYRIALYSAPYYDDYNFGLFVKNFLELDKSLYSALQGALYCVKTQWYAWQGTYSATFFNCLMPAAWGDQYYLLGPIFLITILPVAVFTLVKTLLMDVLKVSRASCLVIQTITAAMVVVLLYSPQQGFYWYVGGICYVGMHSFLLILISAWIKLLVGSGRIETVLLVTGTMLGAIIAGGATYITALQGILICVGLVIIGILRKRKGVICILPSLVLYVIGFFLNVTAPGNHVRAQWYAGQGYSPVEAIFQSFLEAFLHIGKFSGWITLVILILLVPIVWRALEYTDYHFRLPGIVLILSFCFYATGFTPSLYAMGTVGFGRTLNAVKITYQLLLVLNEVYFLGWLKGTIAQKKEFVPGLGCPWWFYGLVGVAMVLVFLFFSPNQIGYYSPYSAYYFVHSGEAYNFHREYQERVEAIKNGGDDVVVPPYYFRPWLLNIADLEANPDSEANRAIAAWYYKNSVTCVLKDAE